MLELNFSSTKLLERKTKVKMKFFHLSFFVVFLILESCKGNKFLLITESAQANHFTATQPKKLDHFTIADHYFPIYKIV